MLLFKGADPNARDAEGLTPLHLAAAHGDTEGVEVLISRRAELIRVIIKV